MKQLIVVVIILLIVALAIALLVDDESDIEENNGQTATTTSADNQDTTMVNITLTSSAFGHNESIPQKYTCEGENVSPPFTLENPPEGTESFALIMEDPDVPAEVREDQMFDHWILYNIPADTREIGEGEASGIEGANTTGETSYTGPCPPTQYEPTEHRYFFKLFALDTMLDLEEGATKAELEAAMEDHILEQTQVIGLYEQEGA